MTLSKLSLRNARRQAGDYLVYFVTVILSAALIHAFNGLVFSEELSTLSSLMKSLPAFIIMASILVICVMGWLIHYVTAFMLSRRSRELGTYILIGLENSQVARLFFLENLIVGCVALVLGLFLGGLIFQVLRAIILSLFHAPYTFSLALSPKAVLLTVVYFTVIYLIILRKNRKSIRTMNIHDLIYFEKKNEEEAVKKSRSRQTLFTTAILSGIAGTLLLLTGSMFFILLGTACVVFFLYGFFLSFSSGVPAWFEKRPGKKYASHTLLIFRGLSAKLTTMGLTMATVSLLFTVTLISEGTGMLFGTLFQNRVEGSTCFDIFIGTVASDIHNPNGFADDEGTGILSDNTDAFSGSIGTSDDDTDAFPSVTGTPGDKTGTFSGGTGTPGDKTGAFSGSTGTPGDKAGAFSGGTGTSGDKTGAFSGGTGTPGDKAGAFSGNAGTSATGAPTRRIENPETRIESAAPEFRACLEYIREEIPLRASMQYNIYRGENLQVTDYIEQNTEYYSYYGYDPLMAYSDYAALRRMLGYSDVPLEPGHYIIHSMAYLGDLMEDYSQVVSVGGTCLSPESVHTEHFAQKLWDGNGRGFLLVVPDECLVSRPVSHTIYGAMTSVPLTQAQDDRLQEIHESQRGGSAGLAHFSSGDSTLMSKTSLAREYAATSACTIFPLYYLALILTMAAATILTVQQLSESIRYRQQFTLLRKLGMDRLEMAQTLRKQLALYYCLPALPPLLISIPLLCAMGNTFEPGTISGPEQLAGILGTALGFFFLIYLVYALMAYGKLHAQLKTFAE